ncbi:hypothetical protein BDV96DRAFT_650236 [Lophiotrema nucula]|uniref:SET domain-containing protein n=1 Tax=Lophiotrema nucula TaxID=690887 RepID=A0A6A5YV91_9PLEO|nr:hypothetical protein BDV96DRAFT_650236 [Lophiotrema nucula]
MDHPYSKLRMPANVPFTLKPSPGQGWGAFATEDIARGALILKEEPLFIISKHHTEITELDLYHAYQNLSPRDKRQFECLRDNADKPFQSLVAAFSENSFALKDNPGGELCRVYGLLLLHARFNHACIFNAKVPSTNPGVFAIFATRNIRAGEEITFCYNNDFEGRTRQERHAALRFNCTCRACVPSDFQTLSDMRRRLIRGLRYLTLGHDLGGTKPTPSIIFDPGLRQAAETFSITLCARFIYNLLTMALMEEEGLLDGFMLERMEPGIRSCGTLFQTPRNVQIASQALARETWLEKFCVAVRLWGQNDAVDTELIAQLQLLKRLRGLKTT